MFEPERLQILDDLDTFAMGKILYDENLFKDDILPHFQTSNANYFKHCLLTLQDTYPYFKIRETNDLDCLFVFTLSLPRSLKAYYKILKESINRSLDYMDAFIVEVESDWRGNEFHLSRNDCIQYCTLLKDILSVFKEMKLIGVS